jgi:hypothetical protein
MVIASTSYPSRPPGIAVANASGKGIPVALIVANVQSSLRTAADFKTREESNGKSFGATKLEIC